jgi:hypothetical protein
VPWRHGVVSTPLLTSAYVYAAGIVDYMPEEFHGQGLPLEWIGLGSGIGIVSASLARWHRTRSLARTCFTAAWTAAAGGWLTWCAHTTPWSTTSLGLAAVGTAALGPLYALDRHARRAEIAEKWEAEAGESIPAERPSEWDGLFTVCGLREVKVLRRDETRTGYVLRLWFSPTGSGGEDFNEAVLRKMERAHGSLRRGALTFAPGEYAAEGELHVRTAEPDTGVVPLPADDHPLTIKQPLTVGLLESGKPIEITFRGARILIAGMSGAGKSVTLHVLLSVLTRCTDAVVWMIDLAGGVTARRWLMPWLQRWDGCDRPIIDWVATTPEEAMRVLNAALAINDDRTALMRGGKMNPTRERPALFVLSDENPDLMAFNLRAREPKIRLAKKVRKTAGGLVDAAQRGTSQNTGGNEIASQYDVVIGHGVNKKSETVHIFPDHHRQVNLVALGPGECYAKIGKAAPEPGRIFFVDDDEDCDQVEQLAAARSNIRPDLDERAARIADRFGYADRWSDPKRIGWLVDAYSDNPRPPAAGTREPSRPASRLTPIRPVADYLAGARTAHNDAPEDDGEDVPGGEELVAEIEKWMREHQGVDLDKGEPRPGRAEDPRRALVRDIVAQAGEKGIRVAALMTRLTQRLGEQRPAREVVQRWLRQEVNEGRMRQLQTGWYAAVKEEGEG